MQRKVHNGRTSFSEKSASRGIVALLLALSLTGCTSSLAKHSVALSAATAPVVDQASAAYRNAESLHDIRVDYDAVTEFDAKQPVYNPRTIQPLLSEKDIQVRLAVLAALQCYAQSLVEITSGLNSPALDAASASLGSSLSSLGNTFAPSLESALGIAAEPAPTQTTATTSANAVPTTPSPAPAISTATQNGISTAVNALGQFLVSKKIKSELPQKIKDMDPHVRALCELLEKDIDILQSQEKLDYNSLINGQTQFIQTSKLDPQLRREQIMKLPKIVRQQRLTDEQLTELRAAIVRLALTHHALAADAQGNNPESLTSKLAELAAAGSNLGKFYSSLPTK